MNLTPVQGLMFLVQHLTTILKDGVYERNNRTAIPRTVGANATTWFGEQNPKENKLMCLAADLLGLGAPPDIQKTPAILATHIARLARKAQVGTSTMELDSEKNIYLLGDSYPFNKHETHPLETWAGDVLDIYAKVQHGIISTKAGFIPPVVEKQKLCDWDSLACQNLFSLLRHLERQIAQELGVDPESRAMETQVLFTKRSWGDVAQQNNWKWETFKNCRTAVQNLINGTLFFKGDLPTDVLIESIEYRDDGVYGCMQCQVRKRLVLVG